jgi:hypothetical protein
MPGERDKNLRSGDLHEEFGMLMLRPLAFITPVPRQEDVGLDAVGTLILYEGRRLIPEDTFGVQIKASSSRTVEFAKKPGADWLMNLPHPFFVASVRMKDATVDLYPVHNLFHVRPHTGLKEVYLHLDECPQQYGTTEISNVHIGPPALSWTAANFVDPGFPNWAYPVLKSHILASQQNIAGRAIGYTPMVRWKTNETLEFTGGVSLFGGQQELAAALQNLTAPIRSLLPQMGYPNKLAHVPAIFEFIKVMRILGHDPDPEDRLLSLTVSDGLYSEEGRNIINKLLDMGMSKQSPVANSIRAQART